MRFLNLLFWVSVSQALMAFGAQADTASGPRAQAGMLCPSLAEASEFYQRGRESFDRAAYAEALRCFQQAYALCPEPILLWNMARCEQESSHLHSARDLYQRFLGETVDVAELAAQRDAARKHVQELSPPPVERAVVLNKKLFWPGLAIATVGLSGLLAAAGFYAQLSQENSDFDNTIDEMLKRSARDQASLYATGTIASVVTGGVCLTIGVALLGKSVTKGRRRGSMPAISLMLTHAAGGNRVFAGQKY